MDNFMDTITHRFDATDMIKANFQADAAELDTKKEQIQMFENQMQKVDFALSDIREVSMKNIEAAQDVKDLAKASTEGINKTVDVSIARLDKTVDESLAKIAEIKEASDSVEAIAAVKEELDALSEKISTMYKEVEEFAHSDHVKIYRNVQASFNEELEKRVEELKKAQKDKGALMPLAVITMIVSALTLVLTLLRMFGLL